MNIAAVAEYEGLIYYHAFAYCASMNRDANDNGKIDDAEMNWYLPSQNQLMAMYVFSDGLTAAPFATHAYWSASSNSLTHAWLVNFVDDSTNAVSQYATYRIRCVSDI